ncbi:MAG: hypothetical protein Fur0037_01530 [Planctomycetota bacterium]
MSGLIRATGSITLCTLASRILGLARDILMTRLFGANWVQGTFLVAWTLPNLMRRFLGEGALSASLIPAYSKTRVLEGPEAARRLLAEVVGAVVTILLPFAALVSIASLLLPGSAVPAPADKGAEAGALLIRLNSILFLYALPVCLTALYSGAANSLGLFAVPAAVPIVLNVFWIAALALAPLLGANGDPGIALWTAAALLAAGFAQLALVLWPLWRRGALLFPRFGLPKRGTAAFSVFAAMAPMVLGMSLSQISSLIDQGLAYYLVAPGAVTYVYLANRLLLFPHALTALSVAVAVFPRMAEEATRKDRARLRETLDLAAGATVLVTLPAALGLVSLGEDVVRVLFESPKFGAEQIAPATLTACSLVVGLPFVGLAQLHARGFYAVGDSGTPAKLAAWLVLANAGLGVLLLAATNLGTAGLALASTATSTANALWLRAKFARHAPRGKGIAGAWLRSAAATAAMCAALPVLRLCGQEAPRLDRALGNLLFPIACGAAIYTAALRVMRSPELDALLARLRRGLR